MKNEAGCRSLIEKTRGFCQPLKSQISKSAAASKQQPTMADFAFSAVSAFFGEDQDASPDKKKDEKPKHSSVVKTGGRKQARLGLGATTEDSRPNQQQSQIGKASGAKDIGRKILSVGKSKRGRTHDDDDDNDATGDHDDRNDDDEADEEEGRTSAVKSRAPKRTFDAAAAVMSEQPAKKKKKKKAGKKERAAAAAAADAETGAEGQDKETGNEGAEEDNGNEQDVDNDDAANTQSKRKRKKVRSRQKNIRKDNRPARDKPSHLVLGTGNYGGRALTPETRKAMNLPESRTKQRAKRLLKEGGGHGGDGNADIHEDHHSGSGIDSGNVGLGLAVDDMLDDLGVVAGTDGGQQGQGSNKEKKPKKKKKKSKFKNLR